MCKWWINAKRSLLSYFKVINENDSCALIGILRKTKPFFETNNFTALYDKDYDNGCEIKMAVRSGINITIAIQVSPPLHQSTTT